MNQIHELAPVQGPQPDLQTQSRFGALRNPKLATLLSFVALGGAPAQAQTETDPIYGDVAAKGFNQFSYTNPSEVLDTVQKELVPKEGMVVSAFRVSKDGFIAQGACENGSKLRLVEGSTSAGVSQTKCDGSVVAGSPISSTQLQETMNKVTGELINDVPGQAVDFKQKATSVTGSASGVSAAISCPSPKSNQAALSYKTVSASNANSAKLQFCKSNKSRVELSKPNKNHPTFGQAFNAFLNDKYRNREEWGGDYFSDDNLLYTCPDAPKNQYPGEKFSYKPKTGKISINQHISNYSRYCDPAVKFTTETRAEFREEGSKKFKKVGKSVIYISGMKEILMFGGYGMSLNQQKHKTTIKNAKGLCSNKGGDLRIKFIYRSRSTPKHVNKWLSTGRIPASTGSYTSSSKNVC